MYMTANNQFYTQGDGGFINVSDNPIYLSQVEFL